MKRLEFLNNEKNVNDIEIIDGKLVRHLGMTKIATGKKTPFQRLLDKIRLDPSMLNDEQFDRLSQKIFYVPPPTLQPAKCLLFSSNDDRIIDSWNDNCRRYFESVLAKKLLMRALHPESVRQIEPLIDNMTTFLIREYRNNCGEFLAQWETARLAPSVVNDESLDFFSSQRPDLVSLINDQHFTDAPSGLLLKLYDLHYLVHRISRLQSYGDQHPNGIFEIYRRFRGNQKPQVTEDVYAHTAMTNNPLRLDKAANYASFIGSKHPLYRVSNRGRVASDLGFCKNSSSFHLGILRSVDQTPCDLRKPSVATTTTRCPDRLYMTHPRHTRNNLDSWHQHCFANGYNSGLVLGLSGSTLLETRAIAFFMNAVKNGYFIPDPAGQQALSANDPELIQNYFRMILGLFVYFEGGHTFSEILSVFEIPEVKNGIHDLLEGNVLLSKKSLLFENSEIMSLIRESLMETTRFYAVLLNKKDVHSELLSEENVRHNP